MQRLIRRKLNIINRLKEENRALKQAALEKEKALVKYAREYILRTSPDITVWYYLALKMLRHYCLSSSGTRLIDICQA